MKKLILFSLLPLIVCGQSFPGAVATDAQLKVAANNLETKLRYGLEAGDTVVTVASATGISANMLLSVDAEIMNVVSVSGNLLTVTRGYDGTAATRHAAGRVIEARVVAWHHKALADEIKAIEASLGPSLSNLAANQASIQASSFVFTKQTPGGTLSAGLNTITLTPVPFGINGTDTDHPLYVSEGTGTAEACLIAGGSALSGASTGSLILNCAYAHSGAWSIQTATAGIQEAIYANADGRYTIQLPAGGLSLYGPFTIPASRPGVTVQGSGELATVLYANIPNTVIAKIKGAEACLRNALLIGLPSSTSSYAIEVSSADHPHIEKIKIVGHPSGISLTDCTQSKVEHVEIRELEPSTGIGLLVSGGSAEDAYFHKIDVYNNAAARPRACMEIISGSAVQVTDSQLVACDYGLLIDPTGSAIVTSVIVSNTYFDNAGIDGLRVAPTAGGTAERLRFLGDWASSSVQNGVNVDSSGGTVRLVSFNALTALFNGKHGITFGNTPELMITNSTILANSWGNPGVNYGIIANSGASDFVIANNTVGSAISGYNTQNTNILVNAGASNNYVIKDNKMAGATSVNLNDSGTGTSKIVRDNIPTANTTIAIGSASTISVAGYAVPIYRLTGTTSVGTISGGSEGSPVTFVKTDAGSISFTTGGNIAAAATLAQNGSLLCTLSAGAWYCK